MYRPNIVKQDPRGFLYNVDLPDHRFSMTMKYPEYVKTYTDLEFEAEIFLKYRRGVDMMINHDSFIESECKRRFGKSIKEVFPDIFNKIKYDACAAYIFAGYITNEKELSDFIKVYEHDRGY